MGLNVLPYEENLVIQDASQTIGRGGRACRRCGATYFLETRICELKDGEFVVKRLHYECIDCRTPYPEEVLVAQGKVKEEQGQETRKKL